MAKLANALVAFSAAILKTELVHKFLLNGYLPYFVIKATPMGNTESKSFLWKLKSSITCLTCYLNLKSTAHKYICLFIFVFNTEYLS